MKLLRWKESSCKMKDSIMQLSKFTGGRATNRIHTECLTTWKSDSTKCFLILKLVDMKVVWQWKFITGWAFWQIFSVKITQIWGLTRTYVFSRRLDKLATNKPSKQTPMTRTQINDGQMDTYRQTDRQMHTMIIPFGQGITNSGYGTLSYIISVLKG